jgi:hypothetical protein
MKKTHFSFLILTLLSLSCARPNYVTSDDPNVFTQADSSSNEIQALIKWEKLQTSNDMGVFNISFFYKDDPTTLIDPQGQVEVKLWMPSMGHGSSPVKIEKVGLGLYKVTRVYFIMPGEWEIRIQITRETDVIQISQKITI